MRLTQLPNLPVTGDVPNTAVGRVIDVLIDLETGEVRYWLIDIGRMFAYRPVMFAPKRATLTEDGDQMRLSIDITKSELRRLRKSIRRVAGSTFDVADMPDILTGPFGYTIAPSAMTAYVNAVLARWSVDLPVIHNMPNTWRWGRNLIGSEVFGDHAELGAVQDAVFREVPQTLSQLLVRGEDGETVMVDSANLRHIPKAGDHLVVASEPVPQS